MAIEPYLQKVIAGKPGGYLMHFNSVSRSNNLMMLNKIIPGWGNEGLFA